MARTLSRGQQAAGARARSRARRVGWGLWLLPVLVGGLLVLAALTALAAFEYRYADRIYPGVEVAGVSLDGMSLDEARATVEEAFTPYPGQEVILEYGTRRWALSPGDLGVTVDGAATVADAYAVGRESGAGVAAPAGERAGYLMAEGYWLAQWHALQADLLRQWEALRFGITLAPTVRLDEGRINYELLRIAGEIDIAPQEGSLAITDLDVVATPGRAGRQVDVAVTRAALLKAARAGVGGKVTLAVEERQPVVKSVDEAAEQARLLLSQPLTLVVTGSDSSRRFSVDRAALRQWLRIAPVSGVDGRVNLRVELSRQLAEEYLKQLARQLNRPVREAALDFNPKTGELRVVTPSRPGQELDVAASLQAVETALLSNQREVTLPMTVLQPKIDSNRVAEMGIVELVSEGTTYFRGSPSGRVQNIINAASKFNNVVIPPGDDFSFNRYVGDITAANGFVDSLIIAGDRTEVGVGGGVCQVSTTAFQAAARGGFPIVERYPHGYVVGYYGKPGLDATIFTPTVDFRFKNDTGHHLLIKTEVNPAKSQVTFRFYGTSPGRTVEISEPQISNVVPPPRALYREDKSLPAGVIKQVDWANSGQDVVVVRTIRNADGTVKQEKITSKYQPWRAIFLYGPGTNLPEGALTAEG